MLRVVNLLRLVVPAVWIGLIGGLSFIETPLKFLAPGITLPLGLGIGRLVFNALSIAGVVLLVALIVLGLLAPREDRRGWILIGAVLVVSAIQDLGIRPALNARSDIIIGGGDPGPSWLHYGYIAAELVLLALLVWYIAHAWNGTRRAVAISS
ncbi:MAG: hypothetical protein JST33_05375 [Actinobacteria bacterium]|nr:hypothetical protein [Actinomycetota bacterium]